MENDDVAAQLLERLRSALGDPNPHLNLIAMLGIYMGSEFEGLKELIVKQTEELDQLKKVVSILKEKIIDIEKFAQQPRSDKTGSSKWTSKKNNMASERKRKHFVEKTAKRAKYSGDDKIFGKSLATALEKSPFNMFKSPKPSPTLQQSPQTASQSINFNIAQVVDSSPTQQILKEKSAKSSKRKLLRPEQPDKFQCKLCNRRYKIFHGGIIKHLIEIHNLSDEDKIEDSFVHLV